jgi:hypothetical protein
MRSVRTAILWFLVIVPPESARKRDAIISEAVHIFDAGNDAVRTCSQVGGISKGEEKGSSQVSIPKTLMMWRFVSLGIMD